MFKRGIVRSWVVKNLTISAVLFFLTFGLSYFFLKSYFYGGIKEILQANASNAVYNISKESDTKEKFLKESTSYVAGMKNKNQMDLLVYNSDGNCILTSYGFSNAGNITEDYESAIKSVEGYGYCICKNDQGEHVLSVTHIVKNQIGEKMGALQCQVSLNEVRRVIRLILILVVVIFLFFTVIVCFIDSYLMLSLRKFLINVKNVANKVSEGNFAVRLKSEGYYEIKEFCDTMNEMIMELNKTDTLKNDFISSVSHELRTPLTAIKGWAETLQMRNIEMDGETVQKAMNIIVRESERLSAMVEELLDFSKIQRKSMIYTMERLDIVAELKETVYIYENRALKENKHLILEENGDIFFVLADKNRIRQVFGNLIDNSLKYMEEGGTTTIVVEKENSEVAIFINDDGCGISEEDLPKIKNKFYKANKTKSGSGIGLAIVDEIIKYHSGRLIIDSKEGEGTTVAVYLPIADNSSK